ncbi:MAG: hypothetical protein QOF28_470, partial [Actinomycetota bacterium]|nr:hypothetical protein [Actinomycetota bacterium]
NGTNTGSNTPVAVTGLTGVTALTVGWSHTCALLSGGTVECWGYNSDGQLGIGSNVNSVNTPMTVSGLTGVTALAAGDYHTCWLLSAGTAKCAGRGSEGQLGNAGNVGSNVPVTVSGLTGATAVTAGAYSACALLPAGTVRCWGSSLYGELGNGTNTNSNTPVAVSRLTGVTAISGGGFHVCGLLSAGTLKCWGSNVRGELGNGGNNTGSTTPVPVSGLTGVTAVGAGYFHTCALLSAGTLECWGYNYIGQLGTGTRTDSNTPVPVLL